MMNILPSVFSGRNLLPEREKGPQTWIGLAGLPALLRLQWRD
jgi:hypothetical protein